MQINCPWLDTDRYLMTFYTEKETHLRNATPRLLPA
jgi:hypothetical protein